MYASSSSDSESLLSVLFVVSSIVFMNRIKNDNQFGLQEHLWKVRIHERDPGYEQEIRQTNICILKLVFGNLSFSSFLAITEEHCFT